MSPAPSPALARSRAAASGAFLSQGLLFAVLLTHLPAFKDRQQIDDGVVTLVILGVTLLAGVGSVLAGGAATRTSSGATLRVGLLVEAAAAVVIGFAHGLPAFCAAFAVYGVALGAVDATSNMQAVAVEHRYGRSVLTSFHAVWSAAGIVGALWTALSERSHLSLSWSVAAAAVVVAVLTLATAPRFVASSKAEDAAAMGAGSLGVPWRPVLLIGLAMACFYVADSGTSSWSAIYLHDVLRATSSVAALAYAGYQGASVLARVAGDHAVRRWGAAVVVRVGGAVGVVGLAVAVVAQGPWTAIVGFTVVGLGLPVVAPLCFAAAGRLAPGSADAVIARVNIFNYAGALGGGVLVGGVGTAADLRIGFLVPLVVAVGVILLAPAFEARAADVEERAR